ncbi:MAG: serine--tRNA ligase [Parcubacteria group bacterium GW2011_GWA2_38_13b]|nr:MAG: serine--tRNA ligase [Parcubacteria group bacterium GW2011_GWA2_38_13b]
MTDNSIINLIRKNPQFVKDKIALKNVKVDIDKIAELDNEKRRLTQEVEKLRAEQNKVNKYMDEIKSEERRERIKDMQELKKNLKEIEASLNIMEMEYEKLIYQIPNLPFDEVPIGKDESGNIVLREVGEKREFEFKPKDYMEIAEKIGLIDTESAAEVSGSRFGYLKKESVLLELSLIKFAFDILGKEGFIPVIPPVMIKEKAMRAMGYMERGGDEIYHLEKDGLYLTGTAEQSLGAMHMDGIFNEKDLPKRYAGFSTCFRREAGSYGKDTRGILRVHQFDKIEMFSFCHPEKSTEEHKFFLEMEEKLMQTLEVPYRVLNICTGDLGDPAAAKYDIEAWMPGQGTYRETHSTSNTTDFQTRRLNTRFKSNNPHIKQRMNFVHAINGTAFAIGRTLIAIIENYQQKDGTITVPDVLKEYMGMDRIK